MLPMKVEPQVQDLFDASIKERVGNGMQSFFWKDSWLDRQSIVDPGAYIIHTGGDAH
jgi:hypothetical protein